MKQILYFLSESLRIDQGCEVTGWVTEKLTITIESQLGGH